MSFIDGKEGFTASAGVQLKGGTSDVIVEKCQFTSASDRPINVGGSTGLEYFRPRGVKHEATRITIRDNVIEGSACAAAFVGVDGAEFSGNTILFPTKWIFRILQETREPGFVPCRNVSIKSNRIVFRRAQVRIEINSGDGAAPETFRFENNHWFAEGNPQASKPSLPVEEQGGVYGIDPRSFDWLDVSSSHPALVSESWCRDGVAYYYGPTRVQGADYASFKIGEWPHAKDKNREYWGAIPVDELAKRRQRGQ